MTRRLLLILLLAQTLVQAEEFAFDLPTDDRWHYPFNFTPGFRATGSCFGAAGSPGFNARDGYVIAAWDTTEQICRGLGPEAYDIRAITVTLTNQGSDLINPSWPIDLTVDEWFTYDLNQDGVINADGVPRGEPEDMDGESDDPDPGRPLELFGAGFGPEHSPDTWVEGSLFVGATGAGRSPRDPFPFVFQAKTGNVLHVEDSVAGLHNSAVEPPLCEDPDGICPFTPTPWAVGNPVNYKPGSQREPFDVVFEIDLTQSDGAVKRYFQEQLDAGRVIVIVTSLREAEQMGAQSGFPSFFMKDVLPFEPAAKAAALRIDVMIEPSGDFDGDGQVTVLDWRGMADCAAGPHAVPNPPGVQTARECLCRFDFDRDGDIDLRDTGAFLERVSSGS